MHGHTAGACWFHSMVSSKIKNQLDLRACWDLMRNVARDDKDAIAAVRKKDDIDWKNEHRKKFREAMTKRKYELNE